MSMSNTKKMRYCSLISDECKCSKNVITIFHQINTQFPQGGGHYILYLYIYIHIYIYIQWRTQGGKGGNTPPEPLIGGAN